MRENIVERLTRGHHILLDGGTGSELQRRGVEVLHGASETRRMSAWSALANIEAAEVVRQVHTDYLRVGADAIISNNFWTGPTRMASVGLADDWERYARAAGENAVAARDAANPDAYVLGGIAPPALPPDDGQQQRSDLVTMGGTRFRKEYGDQARVLADCGVDAILAEYVGWIDEAVAAASACSKTDLPVFLGIRHIQEDVTMQYGERLEDLAAALRDSPVAGIMLMCSTPERITAGLRRLINAYDGPVGRLPEHRLHAARARRPRQGDDDEPAPERQRRLPPDGGLLPDPPGRLRPGSGRRWGPGSSAAVAPPAPSTSWPWRRPSRADSMFRRPPQARRDGLNPGSWWRTIPGLDSRLRGNDGYARVSVRGNDGGGEFARAGRG